MYHVSNQQTSTADYLIIALPCSFSTLEAAIQKWEDHPFGSRNKLNSLIFMIRGEKNACSSGERTRVPLPLQHSMLEPQAHVTMLALDLAVTQNLPKILLKQLIFGKGIAKSTTFWVIYILFLYKVKSPQSNLPGPYQLSCPQKPFMSWDPLLHPPLLLSIYRKHHLLKNISTISTKQQLKAFSTMILNIRYIKFLLEGTAPKTLKPMDEIVLLTLSDNISYPTQFPSVPWFPGSSVLNLVLNCSHSHIVQHTHISFHL